MTLSTTTFSTAHRGQLRGQGIDALTLANRRQLRAFACHQDWDRLGADELGAIIHRQGARSASAS